MPNPGFAKSAAWPATGKRPPEGIKVRAVSIAVVDDDRDFREEIHDMLAGLGYAVTLCNGSKLTAKRLARLRPDLVLLDIKMEKINGLQIAIELAGLVSEPIAVVAMTGFYQHVEIDRFMSLGVIRACLVKPFGVEALQAQIRSALRGGQPDAAAAESLRA